MLSKKAQYIIDTFFHSLNEIDESDYESIPPEVISELKNNGYVFELKYRIINTNTDHVFLDELNIDHDTREKIKNKIKEIQETARIDRERILNAVREGKKTT